MVHLAILPETVHREAKKEGPEAFCPGPLNQHEDRPRHASDDRDDNDACADRKTSAVGGLKKQVVLYVPHYSLSACLNDFRT
jgi:hypothetical protein